MITENRTGRSPPSPATAAVSGSERAESAAGRRGLRNQLADSLGRIRPKKKPVALPREYVPHFRKTFDASFPHPPFADGGEGGGGR